MRYKVRDNKDQLSFSFRKKSWKQNSWLLLLMLLTFVFTGRAAYKVYLNRADSAKAAQEKQAELTKLEERKAFLSEELKKLQTVEGREAEYRKKFGVGLPGENVAIIVESSATSSDSSNFGFWQSIKNFFKM